MPKEPAKKDLLSRYGLLNDMKPAVQPGLTPGRTTFSNTMHQQAKQSYSNDVLAGGLSPLLASLTLLPLIFLEISLNTLDRFSNDIISHPLDQLQNHRLIHLYQLLSLNPLKMNPIFQWIC